MKRLLWLPLSTILIFSMKFNNSYNVFQIFIATFPVRVHYQKIDLKVNGYLKPSKYVKHLGIYIDGNLSWSTHINELCKKISTANGILAKLRYFATKN